MYEKSMITACTHDGIVHGDDAMAGGILEVARKCDIIPPFEVIRSRDPGEWEKADLIFDVGGRFEKNNNKLWLDHHQPAGAGERAISGIPFSSAGLVWSEFGLRICAKYLSEELEVSDSGLIDETYQIVDETLIAPIDAADTGFPLVENKSPIRQLTFSQLVAWRNPPWYEKSDRSVYDAIYWRIVLELAVPALATAIKAAIASVAAKDIVNKAERRHGGRVLLMRQGAPWQRTVLGSKEYDNVLFVVYPDESSQWRVQAVPPSSEKQFDQRKPLPAKWAGLQSKTATPAGQPTIEDVTGIADAVFCHRGLFIAGARSEAAAMKMVELALNE